MMTDKALLLLAALALTAMSLIGIIFAKADLKEFKAEMRVQLSGIDGQFGEVRGQFGEVRRQREALAKKMDEMTAAGHKMRWRSCAR